MPGTGPRSRALATLVLIAGLVSGCSSAPLSGPGRDTSTPPPRPSTPADVCTALVAYWVREALTGGKFAGLDWEQKGLSNAQLTIHDDVLAAARAEERRRGRTAALRLIDTRTRERCTTANGATESSENWRTHN